MSNCTRADLAAIVPTRYADPVPLDSPLPIVVQALPSAVTLATWVFLEVARRRRAPSDRVRRAARFVALLAACACTLVVWRFVALLRCAQGDVALVGTLSVAALLALSAFVLGALAPRAPRGGVAVALALAGGVVVVDVGVRGWWTSDGAVAAQHLMPLQQLWALHAAALLLALGRSDRARVALPKRVVKTRPTETVDALAHRARERGAETCTARANLFA